MLDPPFHPLFTHFSPDATSRLTSVVHSEILYISIVMDAEIHVSQATHPNDILSSATMRFTFLFDILLKYLSIKLFWFRYFTTPSGGILLKIFSKSSAASYF